MKKLLLMLSLASAMTSQGQSTAYPPLGRTGGVIKPDPQKAGGFLKGTAPGFVENKGQIHDQSGRRNEQVKYLLHMPGLNVQLRTTGFSYDTWVKEQKKGKDGVRSTFHRVDIELEGANPTAALRAEQAEGDVVNTFSNQGSFEGIRNYRKVTYHDIYPGIDLEFIAKRGTDKPVEYNFIVHPGADASRIKMRYNNGGRIDLKNGMIEMDMAFGKLREKIPASYTEQDGQSLAVQYKPLDEAANIYAFNVPGYDRSKTLVIDPTPTLIWSTYYGGTSVNSETVNSIDVDASGNVYITGASYSADGIATAGTHQATVSTLRDLFVAKFTAAGVRLWGTYYGGTETETAGDVLVSGASVYMTGITASTLLASSGAHQNALSGTVTDGILVKLNAANGTRTWATYYGGTGNESIAALAVDATGNAYIAGTTASTTGIASTGVLQTALSGTSDAYVAKFDANGVRQWGTYIGGPGATDAIFGMTVDASGNVYISGYTNSTTGIASGSVFQTVYAGGATDMFLMKLNSAGTSKIWGTYWGGDGGELNRGVLIGPDGNLVVAGFTGTISGIALSNGLASPGAYQTTPGGERDLVFAKFTTDGARVWATYFGGEKSEFMSKGFDLDESGNIYFTGDGLGIPANAVTSMSSSLATNCSHQPGYLGGNEAFIGKLSADGTTRLWGTFFGTAGDDRCFAIRYVGNSNFYIGGYTEGSTLSTAGVHQSAKSTADDGFLAKFNEGFVPADVAVTATTISPANQTTCALGIPSLITGNTVSLYNPPGYTSPIFYQWQIANAATGPWSDLSGEVFKDLQPLSSQTTHYYRRLIQLNNGYCDKKTVDSSSVSSVLINANVAPIASANGPQWYVCGSGANTVTLNGSATGGSGVYSTYQWYAGSNLTTPVASVAAYTPTVASTTTYTLKVTDNVGCVDIDQVTVVPVIANAGADATMCQGGGGVQLGSTGIPGGAVTYAWSTVSGSAAATSLSCTSCAQPIANPTATTTYRLTTTVTRKGGITCTTTDDVVVTFVAAPTGGASFGGTDKTICKNSTVVLGGTNDAAATYSWAPTSYLTASNVYNPTFNAGTNKVVCPLTYTVTATKSGCSFTDQVSVNVIDPATSLDAQTASCQSWSSGNSNNCTGATYTWQLVSGPGVLPTGTRLRNSGADAYLVNTGATNAVYRRVTTLNGVSCTSGDITISPCGSTGCPNMVIKTLSPQGCPKVVGQQELQLYVSGANAADYTFSWTPANIIDNPTAASVTITSMAATTVNVTVTNKYTGQTCPVPALNINNPAWSLPVLNVSDKFSCSGGSVAIGEAAASGFTYEWSPAGGLSNANIANPIATITDFATYTVSKTDNTNSCKTIATVDVNTASFNFDAGNTRAVCNGATVTLGTIPGGSYTYSWTPVNAAWANGTGPTNANPQVLFASTSQTFNVTVTDPVSGCQKMDAVTLTGTVTPGMYAGANVGPLCPGLTAQLGKAAELNATYAWSPTTGLSCTTCANPVVTAGSANQTYTVTVSYPGCTIPVSDNVTVSVNTVPAVTLTNKTVCPSTPTNIGIGGTSNTASLANVSSYDWSPATGLSCTNCANPNANPVAVTTYTVLITFTNGCTTQKQVTVTPTVRATAKPDATICPGGSAVLGSPAVANVTYAWTVLSGTAGSITPTTSAQPTANPTVTSVYRLTATGTGANAGCTVTDDVKVTVKALPFFNITGTTAVCTGGTVTLTVTPATANMIYQWSPTAGILNSDSSSVSVIPAATTTYRVTQTDLNSGCSDFKQAIVTVWPNNVTATGGELTICPSSSAVMPLTVTPATGNTITWTPATYLSNAFIQNPTIAPQASGNYIATVINNTTNCIDTALVTVNVPATCLASDYGDAPLIYENGNAASHGIIATLKIGASTDAEGAPVSAAMNALAIGDDNNSQVNDEEGISFLPTPTIASRSLGVVVNNVLNNTGAPAYMVGWIDFNRDGDFDDVGEQSVVLPLATNAASTDPVLQFNGFNTGCVVKAGLSYLRIRLTTDTTGKWNINPQPVGTRVNGEVEDYAITLMGADFGDAPAAYPAVRASVFPDLYGDGKPDATGSVWLGSRVDYDYSCDYASSAIATADDNDYTINDEDGLQMSSQVPIGQSVPWTLTINSQGPVNGVQWGMWIDWNADGTFDNFYNGNVNTASPVDVTVNVTAPANAIRGFVVRTGVKATGIAFVAADYNSIINNGEWEDYIRATPLPVNLLYFNAAATGCQGEVSWATSREHNADYFEIERSADGNHWNVMKQIKAAGNTTIEKTYKASVDLNSNGNNYLRLKMVDRTGAAEYSMLRVLRCGDRKPILVWPNPAKTQIQVSGLPDESNIRIMNVAGQTMSQVKAAASIITIPLHDLPSGYYQLIISDKTGNLIETQQIVKQ